MALVGGAEFTDTTPLEDAMFRGGVVTIYVSDMDRAVRFYSETLGFRLTERHGNHWASLDGGPGLTIGLHPSTAEVPAGRQGSIALGLYLDAPIEKAVAELESRGAQFRGPIVEDKALSLAFLSDPDGNPLYVAQMKQVYR
jgi:catechol 2,3-dioxygenase-like lactoylglutathione lyase family enzyme